MIGFEIHGRYNNTFGFGVNGAGESLVNSHLKLRSLNGLTGADLKNAFLSTVAQAGASFNGTSHGQNEWTIEVTSRGSVMTSAQAVGEYSRWRTTLGRGELITLVVHSENGGIRRQDVRLNDQRMPQLDIGLLTAGKVFTEASKVISESSWFYSDDATETFTAAEFATAKLDNFSDIDAPLVFEVTGPITDLTLGVDEAVALSGAVVPAGETWVVDTNPNLPRVYDKATGANKLRSVYDAVGHAFVWNNNLPAWASEHPVTIGGTGTTGDTRVKVVIPQRYAMGIA